VPDGLLWSGVVVVEPWSFVVIQLPPLLFSVWRLLTTYRQPAVLNSIWQRKRRWICHSLRHDELLHEITEDRMIGNPKEGGKELKCYMIWQMMVVMLHPNGQLRTERDGDTEKAEDYWWHTANKLPRNKMPFDSVHYLVRRLRCDVIIWKLTELQHESDVVGWNKNTTVAVIWLNGFPVSRRNCQTITNMGNNGTWRPFQKCRQCLRSYDHVTLQKFYYYY